MLLKIFIKEVNGHISEGQKLRSNKSDHKDAIQSWPTSNFSKRPFMLNKKKGCAWNLIVYAISQAFRLSSFGLVYIETCVIDTSVTFHYNVCSKMMACTWNKWHATYIVVKRDTCVNDGRFNVDKPF